MDLWQGGAGELLGVAVARLAAAKPVDKISVTELCRAAGVTRDTFYRYADSPVHLLAAVLDADLGDLGGALSTPTDAAGRPATKAVTGARIMDGPTRAVLDHVRSFRAAYRLAMRPHLDSALRDVLISRIEKLLVDHATAHPGILPDVLGTRPTEAETRLFAAYAAAGAVGAIERLLTDGDIDDVERSTELIYAASAPWWLTPEN